MDQTANLGNIITSARLRAILWSIFGLVGVGLGATQVAFSYLQTAHVIDAVPVWFGVALAVYAFLGGSGYGIVKANTPARALSSAPVTANINAEVDGRGKDL